MENKASFAPYSPWVWLVRPIRAITIVVSIVCAFLWLIGALIDGQLPEAVTFTSALICVLTLGVFVATGIYRTHRMERFAEQSMDVRKKRIAEFEAEGFCATRKFIGSSRIFSVDETQGTWFYIDYFNQPQEAELCKLSDIAAITRAQNIDHIPESHCIRLYNGKYLSREDYDSYGSKMGVLLILKNTSSPVFINCFKTENDVELIIKYLTPLVGQTS